MIIINSFEEFAALQRNYPRTYSNEILTPAEIGKLAESGELSVVADKNALFTFTRHYKVTKLMFRLLDFSATLPQIDGSLSSYILYRRGEEPADIVKWLKSQGFRHSVELERYAARGVLPVPTDSPWNIVEIDSAFEVYAMLGEHFLLEEITLPYRQTNAGKALGVRADDGSLLGVIYDMGHTRIVAVSRSVRGQGLGRRLYHAYAEAALRKNANHVIHEWISPDNHSSIAMLKKLGFKKDSLVNDCYIMLGGTGVHG